MVVVADRRFTLELFDPNDTLVTSHEVKTNQFGTFAHQFTLPASASLGTFGVTLREPGQEQSRYELPTTNFRWPSTRPAEFSVAASVDRPQVHQWGPGGFWNYVGLFVWSTGRQW